MNELSILKLSLLSNGDFICFVACKQYFCTCRSSIGNCVCTCRSYIGNGVRTCRGVVLGMVSVPVGVALGMVSVEVSKVCIFSIGILYMAHL